MLIDLSPDGLAVSTVVIGEVYDGAHRSSDPPAKLAALQTYFADYIVLDVTRSIAERFAGIRAHLRSQGRLIEDFDLLIAATAIEHDLTLVTRNLSHFERVPGLKNYRLGREPAAPGENGSSSDAAR
jgi:predicted nucleic acid-binding protein